MGVRTRLVPTLVAIAAGGAWAAQAFVNGRLSRDVGSAALAATLSLIIGLAVLGTVVLATGAWRRAYAAIRRARGMPLWYVGGGLFGAVYLLVTTAASPVIGVALLTVGIVVGQVGGGLVVDRVGLSPAGRRDVTAVRVVALLVALGAVALTVAGAPAALHLGLLLAAIAAGATMPVQQAANGQLARVSGEPVVASTVNFLVALVLIGGIAAIGTGLTPGGAWPDHAWEWSGGVLGALAVTATAAVVARLGVLRMMLAVIAGQSAGSVAIDLVAPVRGGAVTATTVAGVLLAFLAVALIGREGLAGGGR